MLEKISCISFSQGIPFIHLNGSWPNEISTKNPDPSRAVQHGSRKSSHSCCCLQHKSPVKQGSLQLPLHCALDNFRKCKQLWVQFTQLHKHSQYEWHFGSPGKTKARKPKKQTSHLFLLGCSDFNQKYSLFLR